jgi:hypothetical protein
MLIAGTFPHRREARRACQACCASSGVTGGIAGRGRQARCITGGFACGISVGQRQ